MRIALPEAQHATVQDRLAPGRYAVAIGGTAGRRRPAGAHGELPLPPYIRRPDGPLPIDAERYQTVFAREAAPSAAPTAGLHFSPALLDLLAARGIAHAFVTSTSGRRRSCRCARTTPPASTANGRPSRRRPSRRSRGRGPRVAAWSRWAPPRRAPSNRPRRAPAGSRPGGFWADAFIRRGSASRCGRLITNFHLPRSTLLMLVAAFAGRERVLAAYAEAVRDGYRFYSYGDAMLIG
jgi:S-adenosylmethionine:tRNA ribosyltransferase-isomerase